VANDKLNPENYSLLVVDDDHDIINLSKHYLNEFGYKVFTAMTAEDAEKIFFQKDIDCILLDINMPKISGLQLLKSFKEHDPEAIIIMVSGIDDIDMVVKCIQLGANDYLVKPIGDFNQIKIRIEQAFSEKQIKLENLALRRELSSREDIPVITSDSPIMKKVLDMIHAVAEYDTTVLLTGESGTGKELAARTIHNMSRRSSMPFLAVNCGSVPTALLESTLFGHEKGAFTGASKRSIGLFEQSNHGTIFLDEITETSSEFQIQLLRVIEDHQIRRIGGTRGIKLNLRIMAATNQDIAALVEEKKFRRDLFYRIDVFHISLPSLNQRREDIPSIANYELNRLSKKLRKKKMFFSSKVIELFEEYNWQGNIRELSNIIERALIMVKKDTITLKDLPSRFRAGRFIEASSEEDNKAYYLARDDFELDYFSDILNRTNGNISKSATLAGVSRQHFYSKMKKLGIKD